MNRLELIGAVGALFLRDNLGEDVQSGTARFLLDGLSVPQAAAVARAVVQDPHLGPLIDVKLPRAAFQNENLPEHALTDRNATYYRSASCDRSAYLVANVGGDAQEMSLHEVTPVGAAQLMEQTQPWVAAVSDGIALEEDSRLWWERALSGLIEVGFASLERLADYVLAVRDAYHVDGHPIVNALGAGLPALQMPRDPTAFAGVKDRSRRFPSAWRREFQGLRRKRRPFLLKETQNQLILNQEDLEAAFEKVRATIPEHNYPTIQAFVAAPAGWNEAAAALARCEWDEVRPLFEGLVKEKFNLGADTLRFFSEGPPDRLSEDEEEYLRLLAKKLPGTAREEDVSFYESHRDEIREDRKLKSAWDKFVFGKPRETTDFLTGLALSMETLMSRSVPGVARRLRIRCDRATKRDMRDLNADAGLFFALRNAGLAAGLGAEVQLDLGPLPTFDQLVAEWKRRKDRIYRGPSKAALQLKFTIELETDTCEGTTRTESAQLVWHHRLGAIPSQLADDWSRLERHPLLLGHAAREPGANGRRPGAIDLSDIRTMVPAYDRDRGSLLPTYSKALDFGLVWRSNLQEALDQSLVASDVAHELIAAFDAFATAYGTAIGEFRTKGAWNNAIPLQAEAYGQLLNLVVERALGDRNRDLLLRPLLQVGQASVRAGSPAVIVAPWHPLRLAAMWRKARLVSDVIGRTLASADAAGGDTKLFFRDLEADLSHAMYPEVVPAWTGRQAELLALVDTVGDYSLHEPPTTEPGAGELGDDPRSGANCVLDLVGRYLKLNPHERANLSVVLFNCDSARLPREVIYGVASMQEDETETRCQVLLRHTDPQRLRDIYRSILSEESQEEDAYSGSEATQEFMARLRIGVMGDRRSPPDPRDGRPYDIVFSQDVISRHARIEWHLDASEPADLATLLPARWSRRRPTSTDDLKSAAHLCCPVQSAQGWAHLRAVTSFFKPLPAGPGQRLVPVRELDFRDERTAAILSETHDLGAWVVNHDELLDRRQLQNQNVRVIRHKQSATQGRQLVISSRAPLNMLRTMVLRRLDFLQLGLDAERMGGLADKLIERANDISGDIVLRAAKRGESAGELIGVVLSRFLAHAALGRDRLVSWHFLDDYSSWLGAKEETQADVLALAPVELEDGGLRLEILVTEAKYVDAAALSVKRRESEKQLRDTVRRITNALETGGRLDQESWLSRLGDLLLDGIRVPSSRRLPIAEWRRRVREGRSEIRVAGLSHVFVPNPLESGTLSGSVAVKDVIGCRQDVIGRTELKALLHAFLKDADPADIVAAIDGTGPLWRLNVPTTAAATAGSTRTAEDLPAAGSTSTVPLEAEPATALPSGGPAAADGHAAEIVSLHPLQAAGVPTALAQLLEHAPPQQADQDGRWLEQVGASTRSALQQLGLQAKLYGSTLTPNAAILRFAGTSNMTVEQVLKRRSELLTTHRLNVLSVRAEPGAVALYVERPARQTVTIEDIWRRWQPKLSDSGNVDLVIGVREEDNSLLTFSPGGRHAPHTLIAGSTGSGKSVLMQNILLGLAVTNTPQQARILLIDPKQGVDYFEFDGLPHLDGGIIDDQETAQIRLEAMVVEMDRRYRLFKERRAANISAYNAKVSSAERLPSYWIIHDEFAEWMLTDEYRAAVTSTVGRLGVKARAAGIYLIFAAQRPDANVVPVQLRSQLGNRLILRVDSEGTSEISLGERGAERLLGKGHLLAKLEGEQGLVYAQVPFASESFTRNVVELTGQGKTAAAE
ncbi:FtsK/SpoIIIE domain-containing protein [Methylobacterium sp. Leaf88]|uniref:FtsK/SpoIIIE domain-containing protein n=1 Tax=Methylobacterium sp. Leaf88 TaxID=1736244 RepID=UPI0006FBC8F2|nr:FtsK/SpoIIIE domain-containing protein [Methylobacterium sp. Leaf88]KQO70635.1 hypothetical protein ASF20_19245 [Methylobacterium sp. Leaf88]